MLLPTVFPVFLEKKTINSAVPGVMVIVADIGRPRSLGLEDENAGGEDLLSVPNEAAPPFRN